MGISANLDLSWCLIGDFNEMECLSDKIGGTHLTLDKVVRMRTFLNSIGGESLPLGGQLFTGKKIIRGHVVYERLDRVIGHIDWLDLYPNSSVTHGPFSCSNHGYIGLNTNNSS